MRPTQYEAALAAMTAWLSHPQELGQEPGYGRSLPVAAGCRALAVGYVHPVRGSPNASIATVAARGPFVICRPCMAWGMHVKAKSSPDVLWIRGIWMARHARSAGNAA